MNAVDVLAVLEKHHHRAAFGSHPKEADELAEARAAVAELIEAAKWAAQSLELCAKEQKLPSPDARSYRADKAAKLRAALARCGGAK